MDPAALKFLLDEIGRRFDEWETRWDRRFSPPPAMEPQDDPLICSTTTASTDEASLGPVLVRANSGDPDTPLDAIQKVTISCPEQLAVDAAASACTTTDAAHVADISLEPAVPPHLNPLVDVDFGTVTAADSADPRHQVDPVTEGLALLEYNEGASSAMVLVDTTTTSAVADVSAAQSTLRALDQMSSPAKAADDLAKPPKAALAPTREAASRATVPNSAARRRFFNNDSGAPLDSDDDSSIHGGHGSVRSHFLECETGNAFLPYRTATDASDPARLDPYSLALPQPQAEVVDAPNRDEASPLPPVYDDRPDLFLQAGYVQGLPLEWLGLARSAADRDALATAHRHGSELSCQLYRRPAESGEDPGEEYDEALFYENIQAPKFVDLTAPDAAGFYLRMGCDQNHEQVDPEALDRNFFARVAKLSHTAHICADHEVCEVLPLSVPAAWVNVGKLSLSVCWKIPWPPPTHSRLTLDESGLSLCNCKLDFLTTDSPIIVAVLPYWKIDFWCKIIPRQRQAENAVMLLRNTVEELIMKYKEIEVEILRVEVGGCNDVIFCKVADHMEKVASPFVRNTASLGGNLVMAQRDQFASDIATILLAARSSMCIQASPKRLTVTMEDFLQMPPCDHKTLLLSSYIPRWTLIGGLLSGDKTMFGTESKIETSVLFGGRQNWKQREESFKLNSTMKVHCGFMKNSGADMDIIDLKYIQKCKIVVASGIFYDYDIPHQPSNNSHWSQKLFCFLMVVDEVSLDFVQKNTTVKIDSAGGKWAGIWRLITVHRLPFDEPRRNGKIPKILTHRLFPQAWYSIWIDGKMELIVDPLLILERYLWRGKNTFAVAAHKHHRSIYEEGDAIKRRKRYARPLVDLQMKLYYYEGMEPWSPKKKMPSDVPEGAVLIREHTTMTDLFSCLWFNEVNLFTPRDQISFGYVAHRLGDALNFFMFPNCEYNSLFILHGHTREHSSKVEWAKTTDEIVKKGLKESRGGLGLWTPYPADLSSVELPAVKRTSPAG